MGCSTPLLASVASSVGGVVFGYELAIISGGLLQLRTELRLSCVQQEALVSSLLVGSLLASLVGGCFIDRHGRRNSILISNVLVLTGSLVSVVASYPALVFGRSAVGFAMCISSMSCCIFVSEMVSADRRGFLVSLYEAGITVGILTAYAANYILVQFASGWRWMFGLAVVPTLMQLTSVWFLPPGADAAPNQGAGDSSVLPTDSWFLFRRRDNMRLRTAIGLGLVLFQQFTGQPNVLFYASTIFHSLGFQSNNSAVLASVGLGLVKAAATLTSMLFSDRLGRRPLLIGGCSVMALGLITIGLLSGQTVTSTKMLCISENSVANQTSSLHLPAHHPLQRLVNNGRVSPDDGQNPPEAPQEYSPRVRSEVSDWITLMCMMAVVSAYAVGFGPMTWLLLTEIFPASVRGRAFAFTNSFNWAANLLVTFTFLDVIDAIGLSGTFLVYGVFSAVAAAYFFFLLPETKGKTLEEIDEELRLNRFDYSAACCGSTDRTNSSPRYRRVHCFLDDDGVQRVDP